MTTMTPAQMADRIQALDVKRWRNGSPEAYLLPADLAASILALLRGGVVISREDAREWLATSEWNHSDDCQNNHPLLCVCGAQGRTLRLRIALNASEAE